MVVAIKWSKAHKKGVEQFAPINEKNIRDCIFAVPLQTNCIWATFRFHPFIKGLLITFYPMSSSTTFACGVQRDSFLSWMSLKWHEKVQVLFSLFAVKPTSVTILEKPSYVSANREIKVVCQSLGGYPPPKLTWWLGSKMLKSNEEVTHFFLSCLTTCERKPSSWLDFLKL